MEGSEQVRGCDKCETRMAQGKGRGMERRGGVEGDISKGLDRTKEVAQRQRCLQRVFRSDKKKSTQREHDIRNGRTNDGL
jgi:hypothetical protein